MRGSHAMGDEPGPGRRRRALLIANGQYTDPGLKRLRAPTGDVKSFKDVLSDPVIGGFETESLVNQSTHAIQQRIERFFANARLDDLMLLYVSGHGVLQGERLYFATR